MVVIIIALEGTSALFLCQGGAFYVVMCSCSAEVRQNKCKTQYKINKGG